MLNLNLNLILEDTNIKYETTIFTPVFQDLDWICSLPLQKGVKYIIYLG